MFSALIDVYIYHMNISPNHLFSPTLSLFLIKMCLSQTLLWGPFLLLVADFSHSVLSVSLSSSSLSSCRPHSPLTLNHTLSHHSFLLSQHSCHQAVSAHQDMALLIIVHQIIIQTFHSDEVQGVTLRSPVKPCRWFCCRHLLEL